MKLEDQQKNDFIAETEGSENGIEYRTAPNNKDGKYVLLHWAGAVRQIGYIENRMLLVSRNEKQIHNVFKSIGFCKVLMQDPRHYDVVRLTLGKVTYEIPRQDIVDYDFRKTQGYEEQLFFTMKKIETYPTLQPVN